MGPTRGVIRGDTRSFDYGSHDPKGTRISDVI